MTIRELIESKAREAAMKIAKGYIHRDDHYPPRYNVDEIANEIAEELKHDFAAILTDERVGFKEALGLCKDWTGDNKGCPSCMEQHGDMDDEIVENPDCTCPCHTAAEKLAEIKELEAK